MKGRSVSPHAREFTYKGSSFSSGTALAKAFNQTWNNVARRMNCGWSLEQALLDAPPPPRFRNHDGHERETQWKRAQVGIEGKLEPMPDADGFKLYVLLNKTNGKQYVGITTNSLGSRFDQHLAASRGAGKSKILNALRKYGRQNFSIELVRSDARSFVQIQQQEVDEIVRRDTVRKGYNSAWGGSIGTSKKILIDGTAFQSRAAAAEYFYVDATVFNPRVS
jgi:hypothetical protein